MTEANRNDTRRSLGFLDNGYYIAQQNLAASRQALQRRVAENIAFCDEFLAQFPSDDVDESPVSPPPSPTRLG